MVEMYDQLVGKKVITADAHQRAMAEACGTLLTQIRKEADEGKWQTSVGDPPAVLSSSTASATSSSSAFSSWGSSPAAAQCSTSPRWQRPWSALAQRFLTFPVSRAVGLLEAENLGVVEKRGLYLWGDVGVGKTMVLDLFDLCETPLPKRRAHLHSFMTEVSDRLVIASDALQRRRRAARTKREKAALATVRPIDLVVEEVLATSPVLCFDEFQTFDVAHAALLASFFSEAFARGLFLLTTSNCPPEEICHVSSSYSNFLPRLQAYCDVVHSGPIRDYRQRPKSESCHDNVFIFPSTTETAERLLKRVTGGFVGAEPEWVKEDHTLWHHGRSTIIPYRCGGVAVFDYSDICGYKQNLASCDYELLARSFHTVMITNVPQIGMINRNAAHQFVVLVDELYQCNVKLLFTSQVPWQRLLDTKSFWTGVGQLGEGNNDDDDDDRHHHFGDDGDGAVGASAEYYTEGEDDRSGYAAVYTFRNDEEVRSFARIRSRLQEMGTASYLTRDHAHFVVSDYDFTTLTAR